MDKVKNIIKNDKGFTLIEALVTIVIVAIVVAPITTAFIGSITQLSENEDVLKGNQIAQLYLESMKSKTYDELLLDCFDGATVATLSGVTRRDNTDDKFNNMPTVTSGFNVKVHLNEGGLNYDRPSVVLAPTSSIEIRYESNVVGNNQAFIIKDNLSSTTYSDTNDLDYTGNIDVFFDDTAHTIKISSDGSRTETIDVSGVVFPIVINVVAMELDGATLEPTIDIKSNTLDSTHVLQINPLYVEGTTVDIKNNIIAHTSGVPDVIEVRFLDEYFKDPPDSKYLIYEIGVTVSKNGKDLTTIYSTITEE